MATQIIQGFFIYSAVPPHPNVALMEIFLLSFSPLIQTNDKAQLWQSASTRFTVPTQREKAIDISDN